MRTSLKIVLTTSIVCFLVACKTKESFTTPTVFTNTEFFCTQVIANEPQFTTANISKMGINLTINQQSWNLHGSLRIQTDTAMILSLQPLFGFEAFRIEMYPNFVRIFDKLNKRYVETRYDYFSTVTAVPISFSLLQNIFKQKLFVLGRELKPYTFNDIFLLEKADEMYRLTSSSGDSKILHKITADAGYKIKSTALSLFLEGSSAQVNYGEVGKFKKVKYPKNITLEFLSKDGGTLLSLDIIKAVFNNPVDLTPIDFYRYKRVTFKQLLTK